MKISALILAAGASRRMGFPKALLEFQGETFLDRLLRIFAAHTADQTVVLGHHAAAIAARPQPQPAHYVTNPAPERGMLSSLQAGLASMDADAVIFTPVDYAAVSPETVAEVVLQFNGIATIPRCGPDRGHPVMISRALANEILALPATAQARDVIHAHKHETHYVDVSDDAILNDIDDPEAYQRLLKTIA